nr:wound-induced protein 1-like [Ipomoea batatas]
MANSQEESRNKAVVIALYEALSSRDVEKVQKLLASDLEWWFHGPPSHQFLMRILTCTADSAAAADSFQFKHQTIDAIGSSVVLVEGCDPPRNITWVHAWTVTDGVITQVREYFNTYLTVTRFGDAAAASIAPLSCTSVWESSLPNRGGKSVPGLKKNYWRLHLSVVLFGFMVVFVSSVVTVELKVNLHCDECIRKILKAIKKIEDIETYDVDKNLNKVMVTGKVTNEEVVKALHKIGKQASSWGEE